MWSLRILPLFLSFIQTQGTLISDIGCSCATTKTAVITPNANTNIVAGCSFKPDWNSLTTKWCLTDQSYGQCGTLQSGFGYVDTCNSASFSMVSVLPSINLEWDQSPTTFYTGELLTVTWSSVNIAPDEWLKVSYTGVSLRTLTTGSGTNVTLGSFSARLSDSSQSLVTTTPILVSTTTNTILTRNSTELVTILQSRIASLIVLDSTGSTFTTTSCNDQNLTLTWRGFGQAQVGIATVTIKSNFGGGGGATVGTSVVLAARANMTVKYTLPRSFVPNGFSTYSAQISIQGPGNPYTATSSNFQLSVAPSQTSTPAPLVSSTSTGSLSTTPSQTITPTATQSIMPSPSVDFASIQKAIEDSTKSRDTLLIVYVIGSIFGIGTFIIIFMMCQRYRALRRRKNHSKVVQSRLNNQNALYLNTMPKPITGKVIYPQHQQYKSKIRS